MDQIPGNGLEFLSQARTALDELSLLTDQETHFRQEERRLEKLLEAEKKALADNVRQTVKKRSDEISSGFDKEITKGQERLKKVRGKREKAKNQGMRERIEEETADLHAHNRELEVQMKALFQQNHVPGYCNTAYYYSLYFPKWIREVIVFLLTLIVLFLVIPYGAYLLVGRQRPLVLAAIYLVDVLVFGGLYVTVGNKTKLLYTDALKEGRKIRDVIYGNRKKIRVIAATIKKDRNDDFYHLEQFDDEITQAQQDLSEIAKKKKDAIWTFDSVTKTIITEEIERNRQPKIQKLEQEYEQAAAQLKSVEGQVKERNLYITEHYGTFLGKEFLDPLKIGELTALIQNGQAATLSEAIEAYKEKK